MVYALTSIFTEVITNNAAAILMFPICSALAEQMGVSMMPSKLRTKVYSPDIANGF
jgi:di/tricarboxylate transporter